MARIEPEKVFEWAEKQARQKRVWLDTFGPEGIKSRPDAPKKQHDLDMLSAIRYDYGVPLKKDPPKPTKRIKAQELADWCTDEIRLRRKWLDEHGPKARAKRPDMEISTKEHDIDVLWEIRKMYEDAIARHKKNQG